MKGADGVKRVWGFAAVDGKPLVVAYAIPGAAVYGPAQHALTRDVFLAFGAAAIALLAAFLLGGHLTAPIRRLAARVGHEDDDVHDIGAIERGVDRMGETIEETPDRAGAPRRAAAARARPAQPGERGAAAPRTSSSSTA